MIRMPTESEPVVVIEGDCLEFIDGIEAGALITDPPYGIGYATNHIHNGAKASWHGRKIENDDDTGVRDYVLTYARARQIPWACFGSWKIPKPKAIRGVLIWDKGPAFGMGDLSFPWKMSHEEIYIGGQGWSGHRDEGVLRGYFVPPTEQNGRCHPTEKPVSLMRYLIRRLPLDLLIIDPFAGSGPTGVAAIAENRRCILIEKDQGYAAICRERISQAMGMGKGSMLKSLNLGLFGEVKI